MATSNPLTHPLEAAKAYVALIGSIATALLAVYGPDSEVGKVLVVISAVATAVVTFAVPNAKAPAEPEHEVVQGEVVNDPTHYDGHGGTF